MAVLAVVVSAAAAAPAAAAPAAAAPAPASAPCSFGRVGSCRLHSAAFLLDIGCIYHV